MNDLETPLKTFLDACAAKQSVPGGGSVAALVGALAAAMGEMTLNYSLGKKGLEAVQDDLQRDMQQMQLFRAAMQELVLEDQRAFAAMSQARKLPADTPDRADAISQAIMRCAQTPARIAQIASEILQLAEHVTPRANRFLLSDLAVCAELSMAALRCGIYNVHVNLPEIADVGQRGALQREMEQLHAEGRQRIERVIPRIWQRIENSA